MEFVLTVGGVCAALIAVIAFLGMMRTKVVRPMWRAFRRGNRAVDDILGTPARDDGPGGTTIPAVPSLAARVAEQTELASSTALAVERLADQLAQQGHRLDEHLTWHSGGGKARANGPRPAEPRTPAT
jgi:hypothetical protein